MAFRAQKLEAPKYDFRRIYREWRPAERGGFARAVQQYQRAAGAREAPYREHVQLVQQYNTLHHQLEEVCAAMADANRFLRQHDDMVFDAEDELVARCERFISGRPSEVRGEYRVLHPNSWILGGPTTGPVNTGESYARRAASAKPPTPAEAARTGRSSSRGRGGRNNAPPRVPQTRGYNARRPRRLVLSLGAGRPAE